MNSNDGTCSSRQSDRFISCLAAGSPPPRPPARVRHGAVRPNVLRGSAVGGACRLLAGAGPGRRGASGAAAGSRCKRRVAAAAAARSAPASGALRGAVLGVRRPDARTHGASGRCRRPGVVGGPGGAPRARRRAQISRREGARPCRCGLQAVRRGGGRPRGPNSDWTIRRPRFGPALFVQLSEGQKSQV